MKKLKLGIALGCMMLGVCCLFGCGNSGTEERIKTGEEIAVEQKQKAEDAVDKANESVMELQQQADEIDDAQ